MLRDNKEFEVELVVVTTHLYTVLARTPEEAIADAENLYEDEDRGDVIGHDIEIADAYPIDESPLEDDEDVVDDDE
jgi:hypothetical protein